MCGRYASTSSSKELQSFFDTMQTVGDELPPSYNVAPTQPVRVILERTPHGEPDADPQRQLRTVTGDVDRTNSQSRTTSSLPPDAPNDLRLAHANSLLEVRPDDAVLTLREGLARRLSGEGCTHGRSLGVRD